AEKGTRTFITDTCFSAALSKRHAARYTSVGPESQVLSVAVPIHFLAVAAFVQFLAERALATRGHALAAVVGRQRGSEFWRDVPFPFGWGVNGAGRKVSGPFSPRSGEDG